MTENEFVKIINSIGGKVYLVGGYVRDRYLGIKSKDKDYCITGIPSYEFTYAIPDAILIGKLFPVYTLEIDGENCDIAFARKDRKVDTGYRGFETYYSPEVTIEEDLFRRDTTMNSIAIELPSGEVIDPYNGVKDIKDGIIRATSEHFKDDPVRALRVARQASQFNMSVSPETILLMSQCYSELMIEHGARLFNELKKALQTPKPSIFFRILLEANLLIVCFPSIYYLVGQIQSSEYHPEGDAFEHTMLVLDAVSELTDREEVRFASLMHDIGKAITPKEELPSHIGHDSSGKLVLDIFNMEINSSLPRTWYKSAEFAIKNHMRIINLKKPKKIVEFLLKLDRNPLGVEGFKVIVIADSKHLPLFLEYANVFIEKMKNIKGEDSPRKLKGKEVGEWVLQQRCIKVSSLMKGMKKYGRR